MNERTFLFHFYYRKIGKKKEWIMCGVMTQSQANQKICELKRNNPTLDYIFYDKIN